MNNIKYIITITFILLCTRISAQSLVWEKTYGVDTDNTYGLDAIETSDGGYLIGGYTGGSFYFVKTDKNGDTVWTKKYFSDFLHYKCVFIIQVPDGGYISMGWGGVGDQLQILKLSGHGDSLWQKSLGSYVYQANLHTTSTSDGGYIVTGQKLTDIGHRAFLLKLDSLGNKQWENTYGGPEYTSGCRVILTKDGNYMLVGRNTVKNIPMWGYDYGVYLAKVKPNGDSIWTKTYSGKGNTYGTSIIETQNGDFIIAGATDSLGNKGGYIIKTDKDGNLKWEKTYGKTKYDYFASLLPADNGNYIVTGSRGLVNGWPPNFKMGDLYLAKIDSNGNILLDKYYGGDWRDEGGLLEKTSDGGYILLGNTVSFSVIKYEHIYLAKLDSAFNVFGLGISNKQVNNADNNSGFKVFPNPSTMLLQYNIIHYIMKNLIYIIY